MSSAAILSETDKIKGLYEQNLVIEEGGNE